jgi:hypothetical protein
MYMYFPFKNGLPLVFVFNYRLCNFRFELNSEMKNACKLYGEHLNENQQFSEEEEV